MFSRSIRGAFAAVITAVSLTAVQPAAAFSQTIAGSVDASTAASVNIVEGSLSAIATGGMLTVSAVQASGEFVTMALHDAGTSMSTVIRYASNGAAAGSLAVGSVVEVVATSTGHFIKHAGEVIAFVPLTIADILFRSTTQ